MPTTQQETSGKWTGRARIAGVLNESRSGFRTKTEAKEWAREREKAWRNRHRPRGKGPGRTRLADALLADAKQTLPFKKGAVAEANRISVYLRLAGRPTLKAVPCREVQEVAGAGRGGAPALKYFEIEEVPPEAERRIVPCLKRGRDQLARASEACDAIRKRLAHMWVADISPADLNELRLARQAEGKGPSTLRHDVHVIRSFINRVRITWNWSELRPITEHDLSFPALPEGRQQVMDYDQEKLIAQALQTSYHPKALSAVAFLVETTMRFTEAMDTACWGHVLWDQQRLKLVDAKGGAREVPLSKGAMQVLESMKRGAAHEPIFGISYESLKAIFRRACERAGVEDLNLHDLRHTGATRAAKRLNGNIFLLQLITGHRTLSQLQRYVNLKPEDAVEALNATEDLVRTAPTLETVAASASDDKARERQARRIAQPRFKQHQEGADTAAARPSAAARQVAPSQAQPVFKWTGLPAPVIGIRWGARGPSKDASRS